MNAVFSPLTDVVERVRDAVAKQQPLRIGGGGSKDFLGLQWHGERLDMRPVQGVVDYEPSELVVTVRAGTPLAQLEALLAEHGQTLAFEPPHFGQAGTSAATVGGMVAAGLSGPARASVGAVRDFVLGLEMVNGQGQLLRYGGQVMKNVAGYDVSRLLAGSWGTLGVITEVSLKVLPLAPAEITLRFDGLEQAEALHRLHTWGGQPLPLNASCWVQDQGAGTLYVRLRGAAAAVDAACRSMGGLRLSDAGTAADWLACRDQQLPWFQQRAAEDCLWRLSVPQTAPVLDLPDGVPAPMVEWHGGLRWVQAPRSAGPALQVLARSVGGDALLFRAEAREGAHAPTQAPLLDAANPSVQRIQQQLKQAFDPKGIFNRGRVAQGW